MSPSSLTIHTHKGLKQGTTRLAPDFSHRRIPAVHKAHRLSSYLAIKLLNPSLSQHARPNAFCTCGRLETLQYPFLALAAEAAHSGEIPSETRFRNLVFGFFYFCDTIKRHDPGTLSRVPGSCLLFSYKADNSH